MAMKPETEQKYYANLWKVIHGKTTDFAFYRVTSKGTAELDTALLADFVLHRNLRLKSNKPLAAVLSSVSKNTATPKGSFEKHFKSLIREQGASSSPAAAAQYLFSAMPYSEKRKLNVSLAAMGIKSHEDMERLLHKWAAEALKGISGPSLTRTAAREPEYGR